MEEKIEYFKVGQIVSTQGLKGDMRVYTLTDYPERFEELDWVYMEGDFHTKHEIEKVRFKGQLAIIKIKGIDNADDVEKLRSKYLYVPRENARELDEDEFFISDMIGMDVYTVEDEYIGTLKEVLQYSANDVYVVKNEEGKEYLIPAVMEFVPTIDIENKKMIINPIKGMLD